MSKEFEERIDKLIEQIGNIDEIYTREDIAAYINKVQQLVLLLVFAHKKVYGVDVEPKDLYMYESYAFGAIVNGRPSHLPRITMLLDEFQEEMSVFLNTQPNPDDFGVPEALDDTLFLGLAKDITNVDDLREFFDKKEKEAIEQADKENKKKEED